VYPQVRQDLLYTHPQVLYLVLRLRKAPLPFLYFYVKKYREKFL